MLQFLSPCNRLPVRLIICGLVCLIVFVVHSPQAIRAQGRGPIENVILITLDGLRGEEVFTGADQRLMIKENGVEKPEQLKQAYWRETAEERRTTLMPFLWQQCQSEHGWIAGDVDQDSLVSVTNGRYFSYPGYNEILCGFGDPNINSNDKKYNENVTVLEYLNQQAGLRGKVAVYGSWDVFPFIINDRRSGIPVNAGWQPLTVGNADKVAALNLVADQLFHMWDGVRYDVITTSGAIEEIKTNQPRVLFVSLGETDDWAHGGRYDRYLLAAQQNDQFIRMIWETTQQIPQYKDKTLMLVTTDHGRGDGREGWKNHSVLLPGSERIWIAAFGVGLKVHGQSRNEKFQQAQVASTMAAALGYNFNSHKSEIHPPLPILAP